MKNLGNDINNSDNIVIIRGNAVGGRVMGMAEAANSGCLKMPSFTPFNIEFVPFNIEFLEISPTITVNIDPAALLEISPITTVSIDIAAMGVELPLLSFKPPSYDLPECKLIKITEQYIPEESWLKPLASKLYPIDKKIAQELFTALNNSTHIEKLVISYVNEFLELEDKLTIQVSVPQEKQSLYGYYVPQSNSITAFFQENITDLKETLIHELVHYLIQKAFSKSIPDTNGFMNIIKGATSYVSSYITETKLGEIQKEFFEPLQDMTKENMPVPENLLKGIKSKFNTSLLELVHDKKEDSSTELTSGSYGTKYEFSVDDLNNLIELSNSCGGSYSTFGHVLAEMLPRVVTLISRFQAKNSDDVMPEFLALGLDFLNSGFNNEMYRALEDMNGNYCREVVGRILENIYDNVV
ncbi:hypothetical protein Trichorick_01846 (plasmid) [Candidatus Trichorickettsia mobilis]|uniref:hypothetical protein n=1 Tax=Candidatus Trichorickettsia mobilis TaxID=1346319 RepID=UPI002B25B9B7|nr:hypothetical protein [Candidatus Trichorickettsia mobilis]WPY01922.1 hypothetical protein Trichorick_01846 [Candidatus Trichorickettsia mobilis]